LYKQGIIAGFSCAMQYDDYYCRGQAKFAYNEQLQAFEMTQAASEDQDAWIFLFLDLVYVGLFSKLSAAFETNSLSLHTFQVVIAVFIICFTSRLSLDEYSNRFFANDIFHRVLYFLYTAGVFSMVINVMTGDPESTRHGLSAQENSGHSVPHEDGGLSVRGGGFLIGFVFTRVSIFLLYLSIGYHNRFAWEQFRGLLWTAGIETVSVISLYLVYKQYPFVKSGSIVGIYFLFVVIEVLYSGFVIFLLHVDREGWLEKYFPSTTAASANVENDHSKTVATCFSKKMNWRDILVVKLYYPFDVYQSQNRLGAFIMMVLGEAIISVVVPAFSPQKRDTFFAFAALGIVFCYGLQYYDSVVRLKGRGTHAMTRSLLSAYLFTWLHGILALCMFLTSVALGLVYRSAKEEEGDDLMHIPKDANGLDQQAMLLGWAVGLSIGIMEVLRMLHYGPMTVFRSRRKFVGRVAKLVFIILHITVHMYASNAFYNVLFHLALLVITNVGDITLALAHRKQIRDHLDGNDPQGGIASTKLVEFDIEDLNDEMRDKFISMSERRGRPKRKSSHPRSSVLENFRGSIDFSVSSLHKRPEDVEDEENARPTRTSRVKHNDEEETANVVNPMANAPVAVKRPTRPLSKRGFAPVGGGEESPSDVGGLILSTNFLQVDASFVTCLANMKRRHTSTTAVATSAASEELDTPWTQQNHHHQNNFRPRSGRVLEMHAVASTTPEQAVVDDIPSQQTWHPPGSSRSGAHAN